MYCGAAKASGAAPLVSLAAPPRLGLCALNSELLNLYTPPMLAFSSSPRFVDHVTGPHHPERPDRIRAILTAVRHSGLIDSPNPFPDFDLDFQLKPLAGP